MSDDTKRAAATAEWEHENLKRYLDRFNRLAQADKLGIVHLRPVVEKIRSVMKAEKASDD